MREGERFVTASPKERGEVRLGRIFKWGGYMGRGTDDFQINLFNGN